MLLAFCVFELSSEGARPREASCRASDYPSLVYVMMLAHQHVRLISSFGRVRKGQANTEVLLATWPGRLRITGLQAETKCLK